MRAFRAPTLTDLHDKLTRRLVEGSRDDLDMISSVDVAIHNTINEAESMEWDFDLKDMWLTPSRWSMMCNQYLDPDLLVAWIERITEKIGIKNRGIATMRTKDVKPRGGDETGHTNKATRRWGSCMLALSYKAVPAPQITLYSRTSYLGYIGALDLTVAYVAARYLGRELGMEPEEFRFVWMNECLQWHYFKSLAYLLNHPDESRRERYRHLLLSPTLTSRDRLLVESMPGLHGSRKWMDKVIQEDEAGQTYGDMNYNTYRRIRRRYHTEVYGLAHARQFEGWSYYKKGKKEGEPKEFFKAYQPLPSTPATELDFRRLGLPFGEEYGTEFVGGSDEEEDDDE